MKIRVENFVIESDTISGYNLFEEKTRAKGNNQGKKFLDIVGWNMTFDRAILKIAEKNISAINNTLDLNAFLELYRAENARLIKEVKNALKEA